LYDIKVTHVFERNLIQLPVENRPYVAEKYGNAISKYSHNLYSHTQKCIFLFYSRRHIEQQLCSCVKKSDTCRM